jgi:hypothetical protein
MKSKAIVWIGIMAVAIVALAAYSGVLGMSFLGGTEVRVVIGDSLLGDAEELGIDYITLSFYATTDEGNVLVSTERIDLVASQTIHVAGLNQGSISIAASLPDGDSTQVHATGDGHVASGQAIQIVFQSSSDPYWSVV